MFYRPDLTQLGCLWFLTVKCNYHCPYCFDQAKTGQVAVWDLDACLSAFRRLKDQYGPIQIDFTGGEPSIHPLFFPLLRSLSREGHILFVATNLSVGAYPFEEAVTDPDRCWLNASLHLASTETLPFYQAVTRLQKAGFHLNCSTVLYPPYIEKALATQAFFRVWLPGIYFGLQVFFGKYEHQDYPTAYSLEDRDRLQKNGINVDSRIEGIQVPAGTLCRTGKDWFTIKSDGEVVRCPAPVPLFGERFPNFRLSTKALPCPVKECWCTDMHPFWKGNQCMELHS